MGEQIPQGAGTLTCCIDPGEPRRVAREVLGDRMPSMNPQEAIRKRYGIPGDLLGLMAALQATLHAFDPEAGTQFFLDATASISPAGKNLAWPAWKFMALELDSIKNQVTQPELLEQVASPISPIKCEWREIDRYNTQDALIKAALAVGHETQEGLAYLAAEAVALAAWDGLYGADSKRYEHFIGALETILDRIEDLEAWQAAVRRMSQSLLAIIEVSPQGRWQASIRPARQDTQHVIEWRPSAPENKTIAAQTAIARGERIALVDFITDEVTFFSPTGEAQETTKAYKEYMLDRG